MSKKEKFKLYNDDCISVMDKLILEGVKVDSIIVDPPYGVTACKWDSIIPFKDIWERVKKIRNEGANIVIFSKQPFTTMLNFSNIEEFRYEIIWKKQQATNPMCAQKRIMPIHENISIFYDKFKIYNPQMRMGFKKYKSFNDETKNIGKIYELKSKHRECLDGSRYPISVLEFNNVRRGMHPTQKPLDLMEYIVKTYTKEGDTVLDFTMGVGTTGIACLNTQRKFIGIEKEKDYFEKSVKRLEDHEKQITLF